MLREAWAWLSTPCSREARRLGYLKEAIAFESRRRRCGEAWQEHLAHCHAAVRESLARCGRHGTALVMGSGLALEYPLAELAARFERVVLADMVHSGSLRRLAAGRANVTLVETDLTGIAGRLLAHDGTPGAAELEDWSGQPPAPLANLGHVDWVLSANLLSQLPLQPVAWLARCRPAPDEGTLERFGRRLMLRHLDLLAGFDAERCLIADAEHTVRDGAGTIVEHTDFAGALGLDAHAFASWSWPLAPPGELADGWSREHRVVACRWPGALR
jgi:hypothetical protein